MTKGISVAADSANVIRSSGQETSYEKELNTVWIHEPGRYISLFFKQVVRPSATKFQNQAKSLPAGTVGWRSGSLDSCLVQFCFKICLFSHIAYNGTVICQIQYSIVTKTKYVLKRIVLFFSE